jgi:prophage regulatory protein
MSTNHPVEGYTAPHRVVFLRRKEVERVTGLSRSSIYEAMAKGEFPDSVPLTTKSVAWVESEVLEWAQRRIAERDSKRRSSGQGNRRS